MEPWLRQRVCWFFLGIAIVILAVNFVLIGLHIPVFPYIFIGLSIACIFLAFWANTAEDIRYKNKD